MSKSVRRLPDPSYHLSRFVRTPRRIDEGAGEESQSVLPPPTAASDHDSVDDSMLTNQQRVVVNIKMGVGETLVVVAYAGTGKTATLKAFALRNPGLKILYVAVGAFNHGVLKSRGC